MIKFYLRFSYPAVMAENITFPDFHSGPEKEKSEYLDELTRILDRIFSRERKICNSAFLSSGVDSSLIAFGIGAEKTFSVAYEEDEFDESSFTLKTASMLGSEHHIVRISPSCYFGAVSDALRHRGAPTGDASYIALFIAAREASAFTDVICSGEGPDEYFCGYPCYSRYFENADEDYWLKVNSVIDTGDIPVIPGYGGDGFLKMNAYDLTYWMHGNIIPNVMCAAEGAGIEIRTPYIDSELENFALSLPVKYKADKSTGKLLFREAAEKYTGHEIAFREKRGFPVPVRKWMRLEQYKSEILDTLTCKTAHRLLSFANPIEIAENFYSGEDDSLWKQIWEMYALVKWYEA